MAEWIVKHNGAVIPNVGNIQVTQRLNGVSNIDTLIMAPDSTLRTTLDSGFGWKDANRIEVERNTELEFSPSLEGVSNLVDYAKCDVVSHGDYNWLQEDVNVFFMESAEPVGLHYRIRARSPDIFLKNERTPYNIKYASSTDNAITSDAVSKYSTLIDGVSQGSTANTLDGTFTTSNEELYSLTRRAYAQNDVDWWVERTGSNTYTLKTEDSRTSGSTHGTPNSNIISVGSTNKILKMERGVIRVINQRRLIGASDSRYSGKLGIDGWTEAATNWSAGNAFNAVVANSSVVKFGDNSIRFTRNASGDATADFHGGYDLNANTTDFIKFVFWTYVDNASETVVAVRFYTTDSSNYYEYTSSIALGTATWERNEISLSDFTSSGSPDWNNIDRITIVFSGGANTDDCYVDGMYFQAERSRPLQLWLPYRNPTNYADVACSGSTDANRFCYPTREGCTGTTGGNPGCVHANATSSQTQFDVREGRPIIDTNVKDINQALTILGGSLNETCGYDTNTSTWEGYRIMEIELVTFNLKYRIGEWVRVVDSRSDIDVVGRIKEIRRGFKLGAGEHFRIVIFNPYVSAEDILSELTGGVEESTPT